MILRPTTVTDLPAIVAIERDSGTASLWSPADFLQYECTVAEIASEVAGYLLFRQVTGGEYEVLSLTVAAGYRRQGVAFALLGNALRDHPGDWFLEVRPSNHSARNLYKKLGFREFGLRPNYYSDPPEPAIVMTFRS